MRTAITVLGRVCSRGVGNPGGVLYPVAESRRITEAM